MSGAQHGYVDPSSTDKGAADETAEVDLQVLCLTGEGVALSVALSVPRSMLGYDLRRLVSEKLTFGRDFNQSLERVTLPSSLQSLTFGYDFDQSLERVTLPSSLQSLRFGETFNQRVGHLAIESSKLDFRL